eukprot:COSAG02_NODE_1960_length_10257_cov_48.153278_2_plen_183_part_00
MPRVPDGSVRGLAPRLTRFLARGDTEAGINRRHDTAAFCAAHTQMARAAAEALEPLATGVTIVEAATVVCVRRAPVGQCSPRTLSHYDYTLDADGMGQLGEFECVHLSDLQSCRHSVSIVAVHFETEGSELRAQNQPPQQTGVFATILAPLSALAVCARACVRACACVCACVCVCVRVRACV